MLVGLDVEVVVLVGLDVEVVVPVEVDVEVVVVVVLGGPWAGRFVGLPASTCT